MNIFVGNLSEGVTLDDLRRAFETFGEVDSIKIVEDAVSGVSKGYGFVRMTNATDEQEALSALNGSELQGQRIQVNPARKTRDRRTTERRGPGKKASGRKGQEQRRGKRRDNERRTGPSQVGRTRGDTDRFGAGGRH